jgi:hypothetical protein
LDGELLGCENSIRLRNAYYVDTEISVEKQAAREHAGLVLGGGVLSALLRSEGRIIEMLLGSDRAKAQGFSAVAQSPRYVPDVPQSTHEIQVSTVSKDCGDGFKLELRVGMQPNTVLWPFTQNENKRSDGNATIRKSSAEERSKRDASPKARNAEVRQERQRRSREEPQASDCDRTVGGAQEGREGAAEEVEFVGNICERVASSC